MAKLANENIVNAATLLKSERERQGRSIESIAKDICVGRCFLEAIEEGDFSKLPELTFAVGFVRAFAKSLKLQDQQIVADFKDDYMAYLETKPEPVDPIIGQKCHMDKARATQSSVSDFNMAPVAESAPRRHWPAWLAPVVGLVGASMTWVYLGAGMSAVSVNVAQSNKQLETERLAIVQAMFVDWDDQESVANARTANNQEQSMSSNDVVSATNSLFLSAARASNEPADNTASSPVVLHAIEDSWVQLSYGDGTEMWSGVLHEGQSFQPRLIGDVFLSTTNAGGVSIEHNSSISGPLGDRGVFVKALPLTDTHFADTSLN